MDCPYCLSPVSEEASVCKACTRDLYLFKPMMARVEELERQVSETPNLEMYQSRIAELQFLLNEQELSSPKTLSSSLIEITLYLIVPLLLLLLAHWLVAVVYDTKMIYLRIISMILPMPFAYILFKKSRHRFLPWFIGVAFLAIFSVIGMSWITSLVDHSSILPQHLSEWREVIEYSSSIAFSFLTGMLLGNFAYLQRQKRIKSTLINPWIKVVLTGSKEGRLSPQNSLNMMKTLHEYGGTIVALGTTTLSIYTGLKGIVGS